MTSINDNIAYQQAETDLEDAAAEYMRHEEDAPGFAQADAARNAAIAALRAVIDAHIAQQIAAAASRYDLRDLRA